MARKVGARALIQSIRNGSTYDDMLANHELTPEQLDGFLVKLVAAGYVSPDETQSLYKLHTVNTCPSCGESSRTPFSECPACGINVAKVFAINERKQRNVATTTRLQAIRQTATGISAPTAKSPNDVGPDLIPVSNATDDSRVILCLITGILVIVGVFDFIWWVSSSEAEFIRDLNVFLQTQIGCAGAGLLSILVFLDARRRGRSVGNSVQWAIRTFLFAIIAVPVWLLIRPARLLSTEKPQPPINQSS